MDEGVERCRKCGNITELPQLGGMSQLEITEIDEDSILKGQVSVGDQIVGVNGVIVTSIEQLRNEIDKLPDESSVSVGLIVSGGTADGTATFQKKAGILLGVSVVDRAAGGVKDNASSRVTSLYTPHPLVTTLQSIPGYDVSEVLGIVYATNSSTGFKAKDEGGSMINRLEVRLEHTTREALKDLWDKAQRLGANAVLGVTIAAAEAEGSGVMAARSSGVVVLGTAAKVTRQG
jgi:uncharacterized protein YbjQ (UPF0145 family)